jgi:ribosomal protein S18 acetylase RimI-like enzyme
MPDFSFEPPLPRSASEAGFVQSVTMRHGQEVLGFARWHAPSATAQGVIQLLDLFIHPPYRRSGHGGRLLRAVIEQITRHQRTQKQPLRRVWVSVEQKAQVNARAFLTQHGFHHTSTISDLLQGQDALIYVRSFD